MAAPYVAAPFTGGSSLALAGIGASTGAAMGAMDGGWKGAAIGAGMGAIPGATSGLNQGAQMALQAGASGGLSALQQGGIQSMPGQSFTPAPPQMTAPLPSTNPISPATAMQAGPADMRMRQPSIWSRLGGYARQAASRPETWEAASRMIAGATEASARNRSSLGDVQRAEYLASGGSQWKPGAHSFGFGPSASSGRVREGASELEEELLNRLTPNGWDTLLGIAGPAASIYSRTRK